MSFDPITDPVTAQEAASADLLAELQAREATISKHLESLDNGAEQVAIGEEFLLIRQQRLYRAAGFKSFAAYVSNRRTPVSRSRAYQLMRFAIYRRKADLTGAVVPANERQSRAANQGKGLCESFEQRWTPIFKYLKKKFLACDPSERPRFAQTLEMVARTFAHWPTKPGKNVERASSNV